MAGFDQGQVFVSYRRQGSDDLALALIVALRSLLGDPVVSTAESMEPGLAWMHELRLAIDRAAVVLVLIDPGWLHQHDDYGRRLIDSPLDPVRLSVGLAFERGIPVVPVLFDDAQLPPSAALPEQLAPLVSRQGARVRRASQREDTEALLHQLARYIGRSPATSGKRDPRSLEEHDSTVPRLLQLELQGVRCFESLEIDFQRASSLTGDWTCIAGINGAGKSTILQSIALALLGPRRAMELGGSRLAAMRRRTGGSDRSASIIRLRIDYLGSEQTLELELDDAGIRGPDNPVWLDLQRQLIAGYGATRNLTDIPAPDPGLSASVTAVLGLFQPMSRLQFAGDLFLTGEPRASDRLARRLFSDLTTRVFPDRFGVDNAHALQFVDKEAQVSAFELPDGYRASVAWMADLLSRWTKLRLRTAEAVAEAATEPGLEAVRGIVLIDELDLHLHASLQRSIVPRLREALPNLQFLVTSHSPLVLSSFDENDRPASQIIGRHPTYVVRSWPCRARSAPTAAAFCRATTSAMSTTSVRRRGSRDLRSTAAIGGSPTSSPIAI